MDVTEAAGGKLDFTIVANTTTLGDSADIHELYFNLDPDSTGLNVTNSSAANAFTPIGPGPSVAGGAGASFDWGVNFGNGGGSAGNGILQSASFTLAADYPLLIGNLLAISDPNNTPPVYMAVHFQSTNAVRGFDSETVGGTPAPVPEPGTMILLGTGILGLAGLGRKRLDK